MNEKPGNIAKQPAATSTVSTMPSHERDTARSSDKKNDDGWSDSLKTKASAQAEPGDESDDSDLDDILDDFAPASTANNQATKPPLPSSASVSERNQSGRTKRNPLVDSDQMEEFDEEEFLKHLQAGMSQLMNTSESAPAAVTTTESTTMNKAPGATANTKSKGPSYPHNKAETAQGQIKHNNDNDEITDFEAMMSKRMNEDPKAADELMKLVMDEPFSLPSQSQPQTSTQSNNENFRGNPRHGEENFQEKIRRTMERMQQSGDQATAAAAEDADDDFVAQILKSMGNGDGEEGMSEEGFDKMLMGMMEQMTNKDILYEPMVELNKKFGPWLDENKSSRPTEELRKYEEQARIVKEIVDKFNEKGYSDDKPECRAFIWEKMQVMQGIGGPPDDLVENPISDDNWLKNALKPGDNGQPGCPPQ